MKIYVIQATKGEYSDRDQWILEAHTDESTAKSVIAELSAICREYHNKYIMEDCDYDVIEEFNKKYPYLCKHRYDSGLTTLFLTEVELLETK